VRCKLVSPAHERLLVINTVAVYINLHLDLVCLTIVAGIGAKSQIVLTAQHGFDTANNFRSISLKCVRLIGAACLKGD
jgi:hypothetical protein